MHVPEVPVWALVHLTHAALQRTADRVNADILHIKGPSTLTSLRDGRHDSSDADVVVRPAHLTRFTTALTEDGWTLYSGFDEGSPFGHAANYEHPAWAFADIHRLIPGPLATAEDVFERLWQDRDIAPIAHWPCTVLSLTGQVFVQALHSARSHGTEPPDAWKLSTPAIHDDVRALAADLDATTALAAGIGELDQHVNAPDYALWKYWSSTDTDRLNEWIARVRATRGFGARLHLIMQALRVNRTHLRIKLGHEPRPRDIMRENIHRIRVGGSSLLHRLRSATKRSKRP